MSYIIQNLGVDPANHSAAPVNVEGRVHAPVDFQPLHPSICTAKQGPDNVYCPVEGPLKTSTCVTFKAFLVVIVAPAKVTWILNGFHCDAP